MKLTFVSAQRGVVSACAGARLPDGCFALVDVNPHLECIFDCDQVPSRTQLDRIRSLVWVYSAQLSGRRLAVTVLQASVPKSMGDLTAGDLCDVFAKQMG